MQITKVLNKKVLAVTVGLALAVGFSAPAQAHGYRYYSHGCSTCGYKYRTSYRHYGCSNCYYRTRCNTCNTCNSCSYNYNYNSCNSCGYTCSGCGYGYYYGGYYY